MGFGHPWTPAPDLPMPYHAEAIQPLVGHLVRGGLLGLAFPLVGADGADG